jgi:putative aldouronate transport system substrate-binding protein
MYYGKMWINKEFLKNVGLGIPTTVDEFHNMLLAFKNNDANGNGNLNDEIPMMGAIDNFGARVDTFLMSAFIYDDGENRLFLDDNGKVVAAFAQPEFQEGLRYIHQLYTEGLISKESFTSSREVRQKLNSVNYESVIGAISNIHHNNLGTRETGQPVRWIDYEPIAPLKGPKGLQITRYDYYNKFQTTMPSGFIPATSKKAALVMRWLDWFMSEEGTIALINGGQGLGWDSADRGATGPDGSPAKIKTIKLDTSDPYYGNAVWGQMLPNNQTSLYRNSIQVPTDMLEPGGTGSERFLFVKTKENYEPYGIAVNKLIPPLYYSAADVSEIAMLTTNINTYVEESIAKFIVGDLNIETGWTAFQNELKRLGIDRYLQIIQTTYNQSAFAKK